MDKNSVGHGDFFPHFLNTKIHYIFASHVSFQINWFTSACIPVITVKQILFPLSGFLVLTIPNIQIPELIEATKMKMEKSFQLGSILMTVIYSSK